MELPGSRPQYKGACSPVVSILKAKLGRRSIYDTKDSHPSVRSNRVFDEPLGFLRQSKNVVRRLWSVSAGRIMFKRCVEYCVLVVRELHDTPLSEGISFVSRLALVWKFDVQSCLRDLPDQKE